MANINELLTRSLSHTTEVKWNDVENKSQYDNSIVFIKSSTPGIGYAIYTQGHTFYTDDVTADNLLAKLKAGENISLEKVTVKEEVDGKEVDVEKVQITATDTTYTLSTTSITNGAKLTFSGSETEEKEVDGEKVEVSKSVNEFSIVGSGDTKVTVDEDTNTVTIDTVEYKGEKAIEIVNEKVGGEGADKDDLTGDKVVTLKINNTDHVLTQDANGLKTTLTLNYDSASNKVQLLGNEYETDEVDEEGNKIKSKVISEFDASAFVKDSFLKRTQIVTVTTGEGGNAGTKFDYPEGESYEVEPKYPSDAGEYLAFVFNTVDYDYDENGNVISENPSNTVEFVPVSDFVKTGTMKFEAKGGEGADKDEIGFKFDATAGKYVDGTDLAEALNLLDSDLNAEATVNEVINEETGETKKVTPENTVDVITGITQVNGKITSVDSANVATTTYVDNAIDNAAGELSLTNSENGSDYVFAVAKDEEQKELDGYVKASEVAEILNAAWAWGTI